MMMDNVSQMVMTVEPQRMDTISRHGAEYDATGVGVRRGYMSGRAEAHGHKRDMNLGSGCRQETGGAEILGTSSDKSRGAGGIAGYRR